MIKQDIIHSDDYWYHLSRLQDAQENKHSIQYKKVLHMEHNITNKFIPTSVNIPCSWWIESKLKSASPVKLEEI